MKGLLRKIKKALWEVKRFGGFFYRAAQELHKAGWKRRNARYSRYYHHIKIDETLVLFEAFLGRGMLCGPYAIFCEMLNDLAFAHFKYVWVLDDFQYHKDLMERYKKYKNVKFVKYMSRQYLKELCRAKYLVNNTTFVSFFTKRKQQVYINTWHGIPLKKLGFDMENGASVTSNIIRNFLQVDYLVSASPFLTEIYKKAYKLDGIFEGAIIEEGYPRLDTLVRSKHTDVASALTSAGVHIDPDKKLILYAPTWKEKAKNPQLVLDEYRQIKERIESEVPEYQVLIKAHQFVYELIRKSSDVDYIIPATIDANEVLPLADILISDYSSIFFDYLYFERPILFYIPDLELYNEYRGLYFNVDQLPGPYSEQIEDVISWIQNIEKVTNEYLPVIKKAKEWSNCTEAGTISTKIVDIVIRGNEEGYHVVRGLGSQKKKILIHRGRMRVNGISTSCLNLLKLIDTDKYDVSLVITESKDAGEKKLIESIPPEIRVLMRKTTFNYTFLNNVRSRMVTAYGLTGLMSWLWPKQLYQDEVRRCFGDAAFDVAVDFEGLSLGYALIVAALPNAIHAIWQHSDLFAEYKLRMPQLQTVFSCYPQFDRIVSCSKAIMEVNRTNLATDKTQKKFVYAKNAMDPQRILAQLQEEELVRFNGVQHLVMPVAANGVRTRAKLIVLEPQRFESTSDCSYDYDIVDCTNPNGIVKNVMLVPHDMGGKDSPLLRFVAVGRLSPEKNYPKLIAAFRKFLDKGHNAMLYILGEGPQRKLIERQITKLNLTRRVILTGAVQNPYVVMKNCDCFILPSLHEGQPMVILEARTLGLPIIMSNFSSAKGSMIPNGQYMIGTSEAEVLKGLEAFAQGEVPSDYEFDADQYNEEAYDEFLCAVQEREYPIDSDSLDAGSRN